MNIIKRLLLPLELAYRVTILYRNGHSYTFTCKNLTKREQEDQLIMLSWDRAVVPPFFFKASDVTMITCRRIWRRRR